MGVSQEFQTVRTLFADIKFPYFLNERYLNVDITAIRIRSPWMLHFSARCLGMTIFIHDNVSTMPGLILVPFSLNGHQDRCDATSVIAHMTMDANKEPIGPFS